MNTTHLEYILKYSDIDLQTWGRGEAKQISDLFREIQCMECFLRLEQSRGGDGIRLVRVLRVIRMNITRVQTPQTLREIEQILPDGRKRKRDQLPSGKVFVSEALEDALCREIGEELGLRSDEYYYGPVSEPTVEERYSKSFPGLLTVYELYTFGINLRPDIESGRFKDGLQHKEASGIEAVFAWV